MNKIGLVSAIQPGNGTATVVFEESGTTVSYTLPIVVRGSMNTKDYWMPEPREQVLCTFIDRTNGFIVGSFYSEKDKPPAENPGVRKIQFSDGAAIEYNQYTHELIINFPGDSPGKILVKNGTIEES